MGEFHSGELFQSNSLGQRIVRQWRYEVHRVRSATPASCSAQGIANTSRGPLFVEVLKCFNPAGGSFGTYAGTLTTTAPNGKDSLTWAYSGKNDNGGDFYTFGPFSGTLTITGGTGKFVNAHGSARFYRRALVSRPRHFRDHRAPSAWRGWRSIQSKELCYYKTPIT